MDTIHYPASDRCVIVHKNHVVAEDLKQSLALLGARDIVTYASLAEAADVEARLVIVAGDHDTVVNSAAVRRWIGNGTPVLVLNGANSDDPDPHGIVTLEQPFRSEEFVAAIERLAVF